jgi:hypothetical protein
MRRYGVLRLAEAAGPHCKDVSMPVADVSVRDIMPKDCGITVTVTTVRRFVRLYERTNQIKKLITNIYSPLSKRSRTTKNDVQERPRKQIVFYMNRTTIKLEFLCDDYGRQHEELKHGGTTDSTTVYDDNENVVSS